MSQLFSMPEPTPGEVGSSASIQIEIVIDSFPTLLAQRDSGGEPVEAVEAAVDAALNELPAMIEELSSQIMQQFPVRMYLVEDDEDEDEVEGF